MENGAVWAGPAGAGSREGQSSLSRFIPSWRRGHQDKTMLPSLPGAAQTPCVRSTPANPATEERGRLDVLPMKPFRCQCSCIPESACSEPSRAAWGWISAGLCCILGPGSATPATPAGNVSQVSGFAFPRRRAGSGWALGPVSFSPSRLCPSTSRPGAALPTEDGTAASPKPQSRGLRLLPALLRAPGAELTAGTPRARGAGLAAGAGAVRDLQGTEELGRTADKAGNWGFS